MNNPINFAYRLTSNLRSLRFVNPLCSVSVLSINKFSSFTSLKQAATSSSNARKPLYEKHIPTSPVQRGLLALGSAVITFSDLYRDGSFMNLLFN